MLPSRRRFLQVEGLRTRSRHQPDPITALVVVGLDLDRPMGHAVVFGETPTRPSSTACASAPDRSPDAPRQRPSPRSASRRGGRERRPRPRSSTAPRPAHRGRRGRVPLAAGSGPHAVPSRHARGRIHTPMSTPATVSTQTQPTNSSNSAATITPTDPTVSASTSRYAPSTLIDSFEPDRSSANATRFAAIRARRRRASAAPSTSGSLSDPADRLDRRPRSPRRTAAAS